jgi:hypothetical protein
MGTKFNLQTWMRWPMVGGMLLLAGAAAVLPGLLACHSRMPGFTGCVDHSANLTVAGRQTFRTMLRAQEAYYFDNQRFATSFVELEAVIGDRSPDFNYSIRTQPPLILIYSVPKQPKLPTTVQFQSLSWTERYPVRSAVMAIAPPFFKEAIADHIVCENREPGMLEPAAPVLQNGTLICAATTQAVRP